MRNLISRLRFDEGGYTLAETLAALLIIGLSTTGLMAGVHSLGRLETHAAADTRGSGLEARLDRGLKAMLGDVGAGGERDFVGDAKGFSFACGSARCGMRLQSLNGETEVRFQTARQISNVAVSGREGQRLELTYLTPTRTLPSFPDPSPPSTGPEPLTGVQISFGDQGPLLAHARVWADEPRDCVFDAILRGCRSSSP